MDEKLREEIALFRYGVIADLARRPPGERGLHALLRQKAEGDYQIPGSLRRSVKLETMRDWLSAYRRGGFEALYPKPRSDQGRSRAIPQAVADVLCSVKEDSPVLTIEQVIEKAKATGVVPDDLLLAPSTVHISALQPSADRVRVVSLLNQGGQLLVSEGGVNSDPSSTV